MSKESVEISINGFSGPLDLLCHLVESRQMQASEIRVTQLVRFYGAWLLKTRKASVDMLAEFFYMVAGLLLQKTLSLIPGAAPLEDDVEDLPLDEDELMEKLARYRPYRTATAWLEERKLLREKCFRRIVPEVASDEDAANAVERGYDIGNLYFLSRVWWGLFERYSRNRERDRFIPDFAEEEWNGVPEALPEESQIESRIAELEEKLHRNPVLSMNALWALSPTVGMLVVTLLAVLEMCRMGKVSIEQEALFSDVKIHAKG
ncbi:MAG: segregation/condensation protein A [Synergistaceae bacterium]|jgi:segregation and condensation protein A|nr:segregation/condensation protein A [Synergistaceae bacterium]